MGEEGWLYLYFEEEKRSQKLCKCKDMWSTTVLPKSLVNLVSVFRQKLQDVELCTVWLAMFPSPQLNISAAGEVVECFVYRYLANPAFSCYSIPCVAVTGLSYPLSQGGRMLMDYMASFSLALQDRLRLIQHIFQFSPSSKTCLNLVKTPL